MKQETAFAKTLEEIKKLAKTQRNMVTVKQVEEAFGRIGIRDSQLEPVYEYLKNKKIGIGEPMDSEEFLSPEEKDYLTEYLDSLKEAEELTDGQKRAGTMAAMAGEEEAKQRLLRLFLPQVADIAKLYVGQGVLLEDLIGEGNVALTMGVDMLGCLETPEEVDGMLAGMIMKAMEAAINENEEAKQRDQKLVDRVNQISELAKELSETLLRKVTIQELAQETSLTQEEIYEVIQLSGNRIEYLEGCKQE